jgi:site-specific DNA recombinase
MTPERVPGVPSRSENSDVMTATAVAYLRVSTKEQAQKGGEAEGYSIPAQRLACQRKAESLGATVIAEFIDAGESARSADRPQLQKMLALIESEPVQYLIVHKVDRLARNRLDDLMISLALERAGVTLISCSENIDKSPSGKLTHGLMALIAEWYSTNLSNEVKTKTLEKVRNGGTVGKAPVGYLNVRRVEHGREIRAVDVDPERAPLVVWTFETYASGNVSLNWLTRELAERGLTTVASAHYAAKPLTKASVHRMLRNPYYIGTVTWQGVQYEGTHKPLISHELFEQVQEVLTAHNIAGEKQRVHHHYLKGSVWCATCGSRLCITKTTNRHGQRYEYFFCVGRQQKRTECTQSAAPLDVVETHVEEKWRQVRISSGYRRLLTPLLRQELTNRRKETERDQKVARRRIQHLQEQRRKLLEAHYAAAIPLDLLKEEQERIASELRVANDLLATSAATFTTIETALEHCLAFLEDCYEAYITAPPQVRRHMNQAVFERFLVGEDGIDEAELSGAFEILLAPDLLTRTSSQDVRGSAADAKDDQQGRHRNRDWRDGTPAWLSELLASLAGKTRKPRLAFAGLGLNESYLVPPAGFEPALRP